MQRILITLLTTTFLCAQSPDITGVWKADLAQSKLAGPPGPPPSNYLVIVEQKPAEFNHRTHEQAPLLGETTGIWGEHGQQRSLLTAFLNTKPTVRLYDGIPTRLLAVTSGDTLTIKGEITGRPDTFTRTYKLSPDGKTLRVDIVNNHNDKVMESTLVLIKQPNAAGDPLRQPEELAGVHFKNVKTASLKNLPASEFIDQMHYFAWSLNRHCEFCHVAHKFESDDKKEKKTARQMIDMVASIDTNNFEGHPAVRCFTCHEGHAHPLSHPQSADEAAAEEAAIENGAHQQPPPGPPPSSH